MQPRQMRETLRPLRPRRTVFIAAAPSFTLALRHVGLRAAGFRHVRLAQPRQGRNFKTIEIPAALQELSLRRQPLVNADFVLSGLKKWQESPPAPCRVDPALPGVGHLPQG